MKHDRDRIWYRQDKHLSYHVFDVHMITTRITLFSYIKWQNYSYNQLHFKHILIDFHIVHITKTSNKEEKLKSLQKEREESIIKKTKKN